MASVRSIDSALSITLNTNGRVLRNLIHGADTVMSHILHFYHLAAADFVNISPAAGVLGSPWDDGKGTGGFAFGSTSDVVLVSLTTRNTLNAGVTKELVESYVRALVMRREAHTMSTIFSGRHPISNAIVPGGVSTIFTAADVTTFRGKLNDVRNFINKYYVPDVVFVATRSTAAGIGEDWTKYWTVGTSPGTLLSYGEYPLGTNGNKPFNKVLNADMLLCRGIATYGSTNSNPSFGTFYSASIAEYVDYSFYKSPTGLHPSAGVTTPDVTLVTNTNAQQYSWLKAPRYNGNPAEVGPLARMVVTVLQQPSVNTQKAYETQSYSLCNISSLLTLSSTGYTATDLVTAALNVCQTYAGRPVGIPQLFSPLGRHAARALECKLVADAMYSWLDELTVNHASGTNGSYDVYTLGVATGSGYSYVPIPKPTVTGEGLAEAPRGALGHWITIQSKKISSYQCVVPSTWNCGPRSSATKLGPAESVLIGLNPATGGVANDAICNIARMLHPYDFCIACAVHLVTPEGKEIAKFKMDLDGNITK
jgi:hydrogenase large subunit